MPVEEVEKVTSSLEKSSFLIQEKIFPGFPGHAIVYRVPVKFDFDIDIAALKSKVKDYLSSAWPWPRSSWPSYSA